VLRSNRICSTTPLEIAGGLAAIHPLVQAVVLPGELNAPVFAIAAQPPEGE
jgi:hypothetical protein